MADKVPGAAGAFGEMVGIMRMQIGCLGCSMKGTVMHILVMSDWKIRPAVGVSIVRRPMRIGDSSLKQWMM